MRITTDNHLLPMIVVGKSLQQMYNESEPKRKKIVAIKAGIEDSNMRASLNPLKNISKNTLRKIATGLDVYPVLFYISKEKLDHSILEKHESNNVLYVKDFDCLLHQMNMPQETDEVIDNINKEVLNVLEALKEKIHLLEKAKLHRGVDKKSVYQTILDLSTLINPNNG